MRHAYRPAPGQRVYVPLLAAMVVVGFVLQYRWMQKVKAEGAESITPNMVAVKLGQMLLEKRGIRLDAEEEAVPAGVERISCEHCMGTGTTFGENGEKQLCPICQGVGFGMVRRMDASDRPCPACLGMGRIQIDGATELCPRCSGRGLVRRAAEPSAESE